MTAPQLTASIQGQGAVNADQLNTYLQNCPTAAYLANFVGLPGISVQILGLATVGDGGQGIFYWKTGSFTSDGVNTIVPTGASSGAWIRLLAAAGGVIIYITSIVALRQVPSVTAASTGIAYVLTGTLTGAIFLWSPSTSSSDNGTTIIKPNDEMGNGRWVLAGYSFPGNGGGISEVTGHLAIGGLPDINQPTDEPGGIENIATDGNFTCVAVTSYGTACNSVLHFNKARGTQAAPVQPLSGDNILSIGARAYYSPDANFFASSAAIEVYLAEDVGAAPYTGCYMTFGTTNLTGAGGRGEVGRFSPRGDFLVGLTADPLAQLAVQGSGTVRLFEFLNSAASAGFFAGTADQTFNGTPNAANAIVFSLKDSTTSRSINAAGTINASGADYAEYETKSPSCGVIAKGQIIGFDAGGLITDKWSEAVSFGIKSTNPNLVGGDSWAGDLVKPVLPCPPMPPKTPTEEQRAEHETKVAAFRARAANFDQEMQEFTAAHDAARAKVDRIAYSGKVPVNVTGATAGDYIVATQNGDGIGAEIVNKPSFEQYQNAVGRVRNILPDGRANVAVIVH